MDALRFDSVTQNLIDKWEFELLVDFYKKYSESHNRHLEFCVLLADLGLLDDLHKFIARVGLNNLRKIANGPEATYSKIGNAKALLGIYESEMVHYFERSTPNTSEDDGEILRISLYEDASILENYLSKNKDKLFDTDQHPKKLMYLTFALNQLWLKTSEPNINKVVLNKFSDIKNFSAIRKAYITKKVSVRAITCNRNLAYPQLGYNDLHKLLGIISTQIGRYSGAAHTFSLVSDVVGAQLKKPTTSRKIGQDNKPRVAVCMSGIYRCGSLAVESIYDNIIKPLEADVFLHSWSNMQDWPGLGGAGDEWVLRAFNHEALSMCPDALRSKNFFKTNFPKTFEKLNTPSYSSFDAAKLPPDINITKALLEDDSTAFQNAGIDINKFLSMDSPNQAKMLYGIQKVHELSAEYEKENGFRYDYIVRCRPDVLLINKLDFSILDKLKSNQIAMEFTKEFGPQDQFWYGQRGAALTMASLWGASIESNSLSPFPMVQQMRAHNLVLGWMAYNDIQPAHTPIRRNMNSVNSQASPPDFSAELTSDFNNEAKEFVDNQQFQEFFRYLQQFNKR